MNTALFNEDMTEEVKERISLANKKILKEKAYQYLHDVLWIFNDKQISSFYVRAYRYDENEIKVLMQSYYICDIYTNYRYGNDILIILEKKNNIPTYLKILQKDKNNMNTLYKEILSNLMVIENEEDPIVRMIVYAKIGGMVRYAFIKEDIKEENAKQVMWLLTKNIQSCIDQLNS